MERGDVGFEPGLIEKGGPHLGVGLLLVDGVRHRAVGIYAEEEGKGGLAEEVVGVTSGGRKKRGDFAHEKDR